MIQVINPGSNDWFLCGIKLNIMKTISLNAGNKQQAPTLTSASLRYEIPARRAGYLQRFLQFCKDQEPNRFAWLAFSLFAHGCVLAPLTVLLIVMNGNPFTLWIPCLAAFAITEIVNLSAMPTKITIPVFMASVLVDVLVVACAFIFY